MDRVRERGLGDHGRIVLGRHGLIDEGTKRPAEDLVSSGSVNVCCEHAIARRFRRKRAVSDEDRHPVPLVALSFLC